jgi:Domain of unknown function (DUF3846)
MQTGILYRTDGTKLPITPQNKERFTLRELQIAVGGYVELIRMRDGEPGKMYANEDGIALQLPVNREASKLMHPDHAPNDLLLGNVIVVLGGPEGDEQEEETEGETACIVYA